MLRGLLLTSDENALRVVGRVFKDLEMDLEHFSEPAAALLGAARKRFDGIVIDDAVPQTHALVSRFLDVPSCNKAVRILLAEPDSVMNEVFKSGTQIIIYKPLSPDRVRLGLRAVRNLMARDRRHGSRRVPTTLQARMIHKRNAQQVIIVDLSDSGAAVKCDAKNLSSPGSLTLEFSLPGEREAIQATSELVWQGSEGYVGLRFLDMASTARRRLLHWLKQQPTGKKTQFAAAMAALSGH